MQQNHYVVEDAYRALINELARIFATGPSPMTGDIKSDITMALGEVGGIWPDSIREDLKEIVAVPSDIAKPRVRLPAPSRPATAL